MTVALFIEKPDIEGQKGAECRVGESGKRRVRHDAAAILLKGVVVICFGVVGPQALATPIKAEKSVKVALNSTQDKTKPDSLMVASQAVGVGGDTPAGQGDSDSQATSQASMRETKSEIRRPSARRRRKPKMAGIPTGSQTVVVQSSEPDAASVAQQAQGAKGPGASVAQQTVAADDTQDVEAAQQEGEDVNSPGAIARRKAEAAQGDDRKYRMAPIKWGGAITETVGWRRTHIQSVSWLPGSVSGPGSDGNELYHLQTAEIGAQTFILHPWVATVSGRLGVMISGQRDIAHHYGQRQNGLIGGGALSLFSTSRFPFSMSFDATDTRNGEDISNNDARMKALSLSQSYRPLFGPALYTLNYDRNYSVYQNVARYNVNTQQITNYSELSSTTSILRGAYSTQLGAKYDQPFSLSAEHVSNTMSYTGSAVGGGEATDRILASHMYMPEDSLLTLRSRADFFQRKIPGSLSNNLMLGVGGDWQPEDLDNPLIVYGNVRLFRLHNEYRQSSNTSQSLSADVTATYPKWAYLSLTAGATMALAGSSNMSLSTSQFGRAAYQPGGIRVGQSASYSWGANAGFLNQTFGSSIFNPTVYVGANQALSSPYAFRLPGGYQTAVSASVGQVATVTVNRPNGASLALTHSGTVSWSPFFKKLLPGASLTKGVASAKLGGTAGLRNVFALSASDTHTFGRTPSHSQTLLVTASLGWLGDYLGTGATAFSANGFSSDLSLQGTWNAGKGGAAGATGGVSWGWGQSFTYDYAYSKARIFGVNGLSYGLAFKAVATPRLASGRRANLQVGQNAANVTTREARFSAYSFSLGQTLRYRIGLNEVLLTASLSDDYGINTASLFLRFRAWRKFGN